MSVAFSLVISIAMIIAILWLLRTGKLREKYAVLWIIVGVVMTVLGLFPSLLEWSARLLGVVVPANLLFALSIVLLLGVSLHVSRELTILEDETRTLAEEVAILRAMVERAASAEKVSNEDPQYPAAPEHLPRKENNDH
ncbi:DUF2304 domain-containing protein [Psychromicrobium lacuslunae]|uniref:Membrane protein n=1 Tax=Psychromicrobium lacuslunae TaxID=1618207 RepID=A0A0D4BYL5_9MICC|nr:DUF2304 domain-containing protein [Psychromicrobium lacuslunae]AJT41419.1 membrane protein [Psychromicrobium lacuslunae]